MNNTSVEPLIVTRNLTRTYSQGRNKIIGIQDIDLDIHSGDIVVVKGDSGSGKSTLLALLAGLDRPTRGRVRVAGYELQTAVPAQLSHFRRDVVGMVFQSFNLLPTLTVMENVCLPALLGGRDYEETRAKASEWLERLGLRKRVDHFPGRLSGGEMQRTAIARALINNPGIVLADEPTGNLDSRNGQAVFELLADVNRHLGRTIIIATHSNLADAYASFRIRLKDGAVEETTRCKS